MHDDVRDILRKVRKYKEISAKDLAKQIDVSINTLQAIENKRMFPNLKTLMKICDGLNCSIKIEHELNKEYEK